MWRIGEWWARVSEALPVHRAASQMGFPCPYFVGRTFWNLLEVLLAAFPRSPNRRSWSPTLSPSGGPGGRGNVLRRLKDFSAAIDDYLKAVELSKGVEAGEGLAVRGDAQKQVLLTYNDFAVQCYAKGFYEEAVLLLNKAIKGEMNEVGLYVNRGGTGLATARWARCRNGVAAGAWERHLGSLGS